MVSRAAYLCLLPVPLLMLLEASEFLWSATSFFLFSLWLVVWLKLIFNSSCTVPCKELHAPLVYLHQSESSLKLWHLVASVISGFRLHWPWTTPGLQHWSGPCEVFIETVGWRVGWYIVAAILLAFAPLGLYLLPADTLDQPPSLKLLRTGIDWVGQPSLLLLLCRC